MCAPPGRPCALQDEDDALIASLLMSSQTDEASASVSGGDVESWIRCISNEDVFDQSSPGKPAEVCRGAELKALLPEDVESDEGQASMQFSNAARGSKRLSPPEARAGHGGKADAFGTPKRVARDDCGSSRSSDDGGGGHLGDLLSSFLPSTVERAATLEPMPARKPTSAKLRIVHTAESSETPLWYFSIPVEVSERYGVSEGPGLEQTGKGEGL